MIAEGGTVKPDPWSNLAHHRPSQSHLKISPPTTHRRLAGILENIPPSFMLLRIHAVLLRKTIFPNRLQLARTPTRKCVRERSQPHVGLGPEIGLEIQRSEERLFSQIASNSSAHLFGRHFGSRSQPRGRIRSQIPLNIQRSSERLFSHIASNSSVHPFGNV